MADRTAADPAAGLAALSDVGGVAPRAAHGSVPDLIALYRATQHRRAMVNGYSGYFAPHYGALQELLARKNPGALGHLASFGELEVVVNHSGDEDRGWRTFLSGQPGVQVAGETQDYTVYRMPQREDRLRVPQFSAGHSTRRESRAFRPRPVIRYRLQLITGGIRRPQTPPTSSRRSRLAAAVKIETQIGGTLADFPPVFAVASRRSSPDDRLDGTRAHGYVTSPEYPGLCRFASPQASPAH